jgi:hypothetical protein
MLADRKHLQGAHLPAVDGVDKGGGGRHEAVFHAGPERAARGGLLHHQRASAIVVHNGFSHRIATSLASSGSSTARWVKLGEATTTASRPPAAIRLAASAWTATPAACSPSRPRPFDRGRFRIGDGNDFGIGRSDIVDMFHPIMPVPTSHIAVSLPSPSSLCQARP